MGKPAILQVLPALRSGGVERGTLEVARAITDAGGRSLVASSGGMLTAQLAHGGGTHIQLPLASKNPLTMLLNAWRLRRLIRSEKIELVHARSRAPAWSASIAAHMAGVPFVTTFHGVYGLKQVWKRRYNAVMTRSDRIIAVSRYIQEHVLKEYAADPERLRLIHRGADTEHFHPSRIDRNRAAEMARDWQLPDGAFVILLPGRLTRWKGQQAMLQALASLPDRRNLVLVMLGDATNHPAYLQELRGIIVEYGLADHVRIAGATTHIREAYWLSNIVVCPSLEPEAFGRVPIEAQAMERPVITFAHGGAMETVLDGQTGWLVPLGQPEALAQTLAYAMSLDPETLHRMGEWGREHVQAHFTTRAMCEATLAVYNELLPAERRLKVSQARQQSEAA